MPDYPEERRSQLKCTIHPLNSLRDYRFVVVCAWYGQQILLSRHSRRTTWETQGGHIEPGETPLQAARRELYEESGVTEADLLPVCDYCGYDDHGHANGMVFLAYVHAPGSLPPFEMQEARLFSGLPDALTYPLVTPQLFAQALRVLPIARITAMETHLNRARDILDALERTPKQLKTLREDMERLEAYYGSEDWFQDRDRDQRGELPQTLCRGVLTEDAVYDLLGDYDQLLRDMNASSPD